MNDDISDDLEWRNVTASTKHYFAKLSTLFLVVLFIVLSPS